MKLTGRDIIEVLFKPPFFKRIAAAFIGCFFMGICVSIFNMLNLGTDPFASVNYAISRLTGIGFGTVELMVGIIEMIIVILANPKTLGFGTVINMVFVGYVAQFSDWIIEDVIGIREITDWPVRIVLMLVMVFVMICAVALYINAGLGTSPYDALPYIIYDAVTGKGKRKLPFSAVRIAFDAFFTILAFVLGALAIKAGYTSEAGIITILITLFLGPMIGWMAKLMSKVLKFNRET